MCERCKKRKANIQYTEIVNGVKKEHNLCTHCARELDLEIEFPLGKLLSGILGLEETGKREKEFQVTCPTCGTTYQSFLKDSQFGCPDCYGVFDLLIQDHMKNLQGNEKYKGKIPTNPVGNPMYIKKNQELVIDFKLEEIDVLEARLKDALRVEDYESAATYRDRIRELKGEL